MAVSGVRESDTNHHSERDVTRIVTHIKERPLDTLVDSGADFTYISEDTAIKSNLFICEPSEERRNIQLADSSASNVVGETVADIVVQGNQYSMVVSVMKNLFVDLILGKDFFKNLFRK